MIHSRWEPQSWKHFGGHGCETWSVIWNYSFFLSSLIFLIVEFDGYALTVDTAGHYFYRLSAIVFLIQFIEESTTRLILLDSRKFGMPHWMKFRRANMHPSSTECKVNVSMIIIHSSKVYIRDLHTQYYIVIRDSFWNLLAKCHDGEYPCIDMTSHYLKYLAFIDHKHFYFRKHNDEIMNVASLICH